MKRITFLKSLFLLCALVVGTSSTWATDVKYTVTSKTTVSTSGIAPTESSVTFTSTSSDGDAQMTSGKKQTLTLKNFNGLKITKLVLSMKSNKSAGAGKLSYSTDGGTTYTYLVGSSTAGVAFNNAAWNGSYMTSYTNVTKSSLNIICGTSDVIFRIESTTNSIYCQSYTITYQIYDDNQVATPSITIPTATPFVSTKDVTISSETDGASFYYTLDGTDPITTPSATCFEYTEPFSIDATTTVKAIAVKSGMTNSEISSATFTKETVLDGISALNAATTGTSTSFYVKLTDAQITYVEASDDGNGFMDDADAGIYLYTYNHLVRNTKYNGVYRMTTKTSNSWARVTAFEEIAGEGSSVVAGAMDPVVMTASDLEENFADNVSRQIKITNTTLTSAGKLTDNITIKDDYIDGTLTANTTYTLVGYPSWYNNGKQFRVTSAIEKPKDPTFSIEEGPFYDAFNLTLSCATEGATIYYTTDGTDPTSESAKYTAAIDIPAQTTTVKAIAIKAGMESNTATAIYTYYAVKQPTFGTAPSSSVYYNDKVTVSCDTEGSTLYYTLTTDGNDPADPTDTSTAYPDGGITIAANTAKIKVIAKKGSDYSPVASATYTLKTPDAPEISPTGGAKERGTVVTITSRAGTTIYYTTNGDAPTNESTPYTDPIVINAAQTIKSIVYDGAGNASSVAAEEYTIVKVATPTFSVAAGAVAKGTQLTISTTTDGASIYYTLDGTDPTAESTVYNGYVTISKDETVKAIAIKANCDDSDVRSAVYTVVGASDNFVFENLGLSNAEALTTLNGTNITLTFSAGTNTSNSPKYYTSDKTARMYTNNTLTVSSEKNITKIVFSSSTNYSLDEEKGTLSSGVWTGKANSIRFKATGTAKFTYITVYIELTNDEATIGDSKLAGYCSEYALNFSSTGLKAYKAKVEGGNVVLTEIADGIVPAYEGVVLSGNADDYDIPFTDAAATTDFSDNEMIGITQRTLVPWSTGEKYNYILQQGEFRKATTPGGYLKPNRAYLSTSYNVTAVGGGDAKALTIVFNDATTGINGVEEIAPITKTRKVVKNGRLVIETPNGEFTIDGAKVK